MNFDFKYHKSLDHLHVNCEKPRAYFVPHTDEDSADRNNRAESKLFMSLCGDWDFKYYPNERCLDDFLSQNFIADNFDKLTVPMSWQINHKNGYDTPHYTNMVYPFPIDPPYIPEDNTCGLYVRSFNMSQLIDNEYYLNFEGVDSCFYLFVNDTLPLLLYQGLWLLLLQRGYCLILYMLCLRQQQGSLLQTIVIHKEEYSDAYNQTRN